MSFENNHQLRLAFDFIQFTHQNIFLTGKAGTGKTTFLKHLRKSSPKRMVVVAPTGVAAINAGGVTIHSFFQLSFGPQIPANDMRAEGPDHAPGTRSQERFHRFSKNKINLIRSLDLLVIDEISMVRADLLDAIDAVLRRFRNRYQPFGGLQMLMIGDLQQLAPVVKEEDREILKKYYDTFFFFSSHALKKSSFIGIELKHIYRQQEQKFIDLLNKVRDNQLTTADVELLNRRYIPDFSPAEEEGYITLTTHNHQAKQLNDARLQNLKTKLHRFTCSVEGDFPDSSYPADEILELKTGAQVMFLKNDSTAEKRYYNGKIGKVTKVNKDEIEVLCPGDTTPISVEPDVWENSRYHLNELTAEIEEEIMGQFRQFPLKLAWAITIHKSQGLTFEKAIIDARQSFAHGQVYVALSRCKSLEGMILRTPLEIRSVINDGTVTSFIGEIENNQPDQTALEKHRKAYELQLLDELFNFSTVIAPIRYLLKIWRDNSGSLEGSCQTDLTKMENFLNEEIVEIADRFRRQIIKMANHQNKIEDNPVLQKRLTDASAYFLARIEDRLQKPLQQLTWETDNRDLRKRINEQLERLESELTIKCTGLGSVARGFTIKRFLDARATASIEKSAKRAQKQKPDANVANAELYNKLLEWRKKFARDSGVAEPKILNRKVLIEIAKHLPETAKKLKAVKGMGGTKMEMFGSDLLAIIMEYRQKQGMDIPLNARQEVEMAGLNTKEVSLALFKQGLAIPEIAIHRNLAEGTIESHLALYVGKGQIDILSLVSKNSYDQIVRCFNESKGNSNINDMKRKLGADISYGEIRLVLADLNKNS